jgi:hypothetical protein
MPRLRAIALALPASLAIAACGSDDRPPAASNPHGASGTTTAHDGGAGGGSATATCPTLAATAPRDVSSSGATMDEAEVSVAAQPGGEIAVAFIAFGGGTPVIEVARSHDGGATFDAPKVVASPDGRGGVDPSVTATPDGGFALAWLGVRYQGGAEPTDRKVYVARASAGGDFGEPVDVTDPATTDSWDKPWITALEDGTLLVAWTTDDGASVTVARAPKGKDFTRTTVAPDGALKATAYLCHAGAHVYLPFLVPGGIEVASSDDGGATWPAKNLARASGSDAAAFDPPSCVARGSSVWVSYGVTADADSFEKSPRLSAIRVARSDDAAGSFGGAADALDATAGPYGMHPTLALRGDAIALFYYAGDDAKAGSASARLATSVDGGDSFCPSIALAKGLVLETSRSGLGWLGDYAAMTPMGDALVAAFAHNGWKAGAELSHVAVVVVGAGE